MIGALAGRVAAARTDGVAAMTLARGLPAEGAADMPWLLAGAKTLSYAVNMAALRHAERHGAGDVIFVSSEGYVLEGPRSTVVIATDDRMAGSVCSPRRRGIRFCAGPHSRPCSRWPATRATTATTGRCGPLISLPPKAFGWFRASRSRRACTPSTASRCGSSPMAAELSELVDAAIVSDR